MPGQPENVSNGTGHHIGTVIEVSASGGRREHWQAFALDGTALGAHARRIDAEGAVFDDWVDGCPRETRVPTAGGARARG